ncbi:MAG: hypothetical protein AB1656_25735 [Candidatus Omnitrophota bacterium]
MKRFVFGATMLLAATLCFAQKPTHHDPQAGTNPKTMTVYQIKPITVDGDLSDWPNTLEKRSCEEFYPGYGVDNSGASTQDNWFMVAWNDSENKLYVAGYSEDDVNVSQLTKWNEGVIPTDVWFYDRWEIYVEWDNDKTGAYGYTENGNVQYAVVQNDKDRTDGEYATSQEKDAAGNILDVGTAFWITNLTAVTLDGRPPFAQAEWVIKPKDASKPFGPYVGQFEMSFKILNYLVEGVDPDEKLDTVDLGPNMNDGRGLGFDVTLMDRDGSIAAMTSAQGEGAWIGWSSGSKNANPQLNGTLTLSTTFKESTRIANWELF